MGHNAVVPAAPPPSSLRPRDRKKMNALSIVCVALLLPFSSADYVVFDDVSLAINAGDLCGVHINTFKGSCDPFLSCPDDDINMLVCDKSATCSGFNTFTRSTSSVTSCGDLKNWAPTPGMTSYLRVDRCDGNMPAQNVTSYTGTVYKYCPGCDNGLKTQHTFNIPPFLCKQSCDGDKQCIGYSTQNSSCIIYYGLCGQSFDAYLKIPGSGTPRFIMPPKKIKKAENRFTAKPNTIRTGKSLRQKKTGL